MCRDGSGSRSAERLPGCVGAAPLAGFRLPSPPPPPPPPPPPATAAATAAARLPVPAVAVAAVTAPAAAGVGPPAAGGGVVAADPAVADPAADEVSLDMLPGRHGNTEAVDSRPAHQLDNSIVSIAIAFPFQY